jgi:hypothetical protein
MLGKRRSRQHRGVESLEYRRELRRVQRRRSDKMLVGLLVAGAIGLYAAVELGRAMYAMQHVKSFAATIDQRAPAEVKQELSRFASELTDHNPFVRNAAMTALKLGTGWNLGNAPAEWRRWWLDHESYWQYHPATSNAPVSKSIDWAASLPPGITGAAPVAGKPPESP